MRRTAAAGRPVSPDPILRRQDHHALGREPERERAPDGHRPREPGHEGLSRVEDDLDAVLAPEVFGEPHGAADDVGAGGSGATSTSSGRTTATAVAPGARATTPSPRSVTSRAWPTTVSPSADDTVTGKAFR